MIVTSVARTPWTFSHTIPSGVEISNCLIKKVGKKDEKTFLSGMSYSLTVDTEEKAKFCIGKYLYANFDGTHKLVLIKTCNLLNTNVEVLIGSGTYYYLACSLKDIPVTLFDKYEDSTKSLREEKFPTFYFSPRPEFTTSFPTEDTRIVLHDELKNKKLSYGRVYRYFTMEKCDRETLLNKYAIIENDGIKIVKILDTDDSSKIITYEVLKMVGKTELLNPDDFGIFCGVLQDSSFTSYELLLDVAQDRDVLMEQNNAFRLCCG